MSRVAGLGFRRGVPLATLRALLAQAEALAGPAAALACTGEKAGAPALAALAAERGLPIRAVAVAGVQTPTTSARVLARFGTGSVAEAAALVAAGPGAGLVLPRIVAPDGKATCAIAATPDAPPPRAGAKVKGDCA